MTTRDKVLELKEAGLSPIEIASKVGVSKQRVSQILNPKPKMPLEMKNALSTEEAALLLGVHVNTIRRWNNQGRLKAFRISTRRDRRFLRSDIDRIIQGEGG